MADRFPQFADGDVRVLLTSSRQYQLHSSVLRNASPLLRELLAKKNAAQLSNKAIRANIAVRHRLVLVENPDREDDAHDIAYIFRQVPLDTMGRPSKKNTPGVVLDLENGRRPLPIFMAYANVLSAMYGQNLELGNSQEDGLAELLQNAFQATVVAEYLDCVCCPICVDFDALANVNRCASSVNQSRPSFSAPARICTKLSRTTQPLGWSSPSASSRAQSSKKR
jgi:hypothetical protein